MIKHPEQRVGVFIDVQNMYYSARNLFNAKVNFGNIVREAVAGRNLVRAIAYVVSTKTGEENPAANCLRGIFLRPVRLLPRCLRPVLREAMGNGVNQRALVFLASIP